MSHAEKVPLVKCEAETVQYENSEVQYIRKVFITKHGEGTKGVWEYAKAVDPNQVFLNIILLSKISSGEIALIVKEEHQVCTHELRSLTSLHFESILNDPTLDLSTYAQTLLTTRFGLSSLRVLLTSGSGSNYSDPWKSNQKVKTVVVMSDSPLDLDKLH